MGAMGLLLGACSKAPPPVELKSLEGNIYRPADWQGKWIFINYWAEWCKPCAEEIPELNKFAASHTDALVFGVNFDNPKIQDALQHANRMHIAFPVVFNDGIVQVFPHEIPKALPATIVVNPEGKVVDTLHGPQTEATLMQAMKK
jgi:thiol-disulfide isomerase/thioredoxin